MREAICRNLRRTSKKRHRDDVKSAIEAASKCIKKSPLLYRALRPMVIVAVRIYVRVADLFPA